MEQKRIAILFSGNGSNLEALIRALHNKTFAHTIEVAESKEWLVSGFDELSPKEAQTASLSENMTKAHVAESHRGNQRKKREESNKSAEFCIEVVLALSNRSDAYGIKRAQNLGIPTRIVESQGKSREAFDQELVGILKPLRLDLCVFAGFMRILTPLFIRQIPSINIHPSLLPLFKGAKGIAESWSSPMKVGGVSVHYVSEEVDSGEIIAQGVLCKRHKESLESYTERIHALEHAIYPRAVRKALILQDLKRDSDKQESITKVVQ